MDLPHSVKKLVSLDPVSREGDSVLEVRNLPLFSWIPHGLLGLLLTICGFVYLFHSEIWYVGLSGIFTGLPLLFMAKSQKCVLDKNQRKLFMSEISIWGKTERNTWLRDIREVILDRQKDSTGHYVSEVVLIMRSGEHLKLMDSHFIELRHDSKLQVFNQVRSFIGDVSHQYWEEEEFSSTVNSPTLDSETERDFDSSSHVVVIPVHQR